MAVIQLNPIGLASTDPGYISSITVQIGGSVQVLTPDGNGQITTSALAATRLVGGGNNVMGFGGQGLKLVIG